MARKRILVFVFVSLLALPATASAAARHHGARPVKASAGSPLALAMADANAYWGTQACGGQVKIQPQRSLPAGLARPSDAWATFDSSLGANNLTAPASTYSNCAISLARWRWPDAPTMRADWDMLCMTVIHETGHLLGHPHDSTPGSVMAPVFTDLSSEPAICRSTRPRTAK